MIRHPASRHCLSEPRQAWQTSIRLTAPAARGRFCMRAYHKLQQHHVQALADDAHFRHANTSPLGHETISLGVSHRGLSRSPPDHPSLRKHSAADGKHFKTHTQTDKTYPMILTSILSTRYYFKRLNDLMSLLRVRFYPHLIPIQTTRNRTSCRVMKPSAKVMTLLQESCVRKSTFACQRLDTRHVETMQ